jgi:hypothetical protein
VDEGKKAGKDNRSEPLIEEHRQDREIEGPIALWGQNMLRS